MYPSSKRQNPPIVLEEAVKIVESALGEVIIDWNQQETKKDKDIENKD